MIRVFCDTETTGLDPKNNGLHQIAVIIDRDGKMVDELLIDVAPFASDTIDPEVLERFGLTADELQAKTPPAAAHAQLTSVLGRHINKFDRRDKALFYAYNAHFDADFLRAWFDKCGDRYYGSWFWTPPIDIMALAAEHLADMRPTLPNFQLATVYATLHDSPLENAHDALADCAAAYNIYYAVTAGRAS